jgi:hypothetical protein
MVRKMIRACMSAALGLVAVMVTYGVASTAEDKVPEIGTIMTKSFKGKDSYQKTVAAAAKSEKWDDAQKLAKEWNDLGMAIGKNKPPKGEAKSWDEQCMKFADTTKAIADGAEKKDAKAVTKAIGSFKCMDCHKAHKGS